MYVCLWLFLPNLFLVKKYNLCVLFCINVMWDISLFPSEVSKNKTTVIVIPLFKGKIMEKKKSQIFFCTENMVIVSIFLYMEFPEYFLKEVTKTKNVHFFPSKNQKTKNTESVLEDPRFWNYLQPLTKGNYNTRYSILLIVTCFCYVRVMKKHRNEKCNLFILCLGEY